RHHLQPPWDGPGPEPVLEPLVEVPDLVELAVDVGPRYLVGEGLEPRGRSVARAHGLERRLPRQHPRLHPEVDALEPHRVEVAPRLAHEQAAARVGPRDGAEAPL